MNYYVVYLKKINSEKGYKKWPVRLFGLEKGNYRSLDSLDDIKEWLLDNSKLYYVLLDKETEFHPLLKSQLVTIVGPVPVHQSVGLTLQEVFTLNEAARLWGLAGGSTIRKSIERNKFTPQEAKKSESTWLVTSSGMTRLFGPPGEDDLPRLIINRISYDQATGQFITEKMM